jgi:ribosomal-protein-alanine N-acetyltransferase
MDCTFKKMTIGDLEEVVKIAGASFSQPWTRGMFESELLKNPFSEQIVFKAGEKIAGYLCFWALFDESHILDFAVHPDFRRMGLGERALLQVMDQMRQKNIKKIFLEVRESNQAAIALYEKSGFLKIGARKGYYSNPKENAAIFQWTAPEN